MVGGGLFDYSVYSWSLFNQEPGRLDQEGTKTSSPPSQDKDQDQELDKIMHEQNLKAIAAVPGGLLLSHFVQTNHTLLAASHQLIC